MLILFINLFKVILFFQISSFGNLDVGKRRRFFGHFCFRKNNE